MIVTENRAARAMTTKNARRIETCCKLGARLSGTVAENNEGSAMLVESVRKEALTVWRRSREGEGEAWKK